MKARAGGDIEVQVGVIWAMQNGYFDDVPVERVKEFQAAWTDFLTTQKSALLAKIGREKALNDALAAEIRAAADQFKPTWKR